MNSEKKENKKKKEKERIEENYQGKKWFLTS